MTPQAQGRMVSMLSGHWLDGTLFSLNMADEATFTHVNLLPEPSSIILLGLRLRYCWRLTRR